LKKFPIQLREVQIHTTRKNYEYRQEISNPVSVIPAETFEVKGFVDAADVLTADQSTIIDESFNGEKTISIRGANEDEVLILYDGIRINNSYDNLFDLSLVDPAGLEQIDIIKGSNLAASGSQTSSAVINLVPKLQQEYLLKFYQRFGTYNLGDWGLNLYQDVHGLFCYGSYKESASKQQFVDLSATGGSVNKDATNIIVNFGYDFGQRNPTARRHVLRSYYLESQRRYFNQRDLEKLSKRQRFLTLKYTGDFEKYGKINLSLSG